MSNPVNSRRVMAAVVLGTALSAIGGERAVAAEVSPQAVNDIGRYCTSCWRNARLPADAWGDCTQEVFRRLLERLPAASWSQALRGEGDERREFVRAIDAVKKRVQRARRHGDGIETAADPHDADRRQRADEREQVGAAAREVLSERQRRIVQLSFDGYSVHEVAEELALPAERVSDEKYKAIRKLRAHLTEA